MKPVMLTKAQTELLLDLIGELEASSPEDWADATGRTPSKAMRDWNTLMRARVALEASYPSGAP